MTVRGGDPSRVLEGIFEFSKDHDLGLSAINSIRPSLEDAFVRITGLSPTVMAREKGGKGDDPRRSAVYIPHRRKRHENLLPQASGRKLGDGLSCGLDPGLLPPKPEQL
jgi:hypothetical protein